MQSTAAATPAPLTLAADDLPGAARALHASVTSALAQIADLDPAAPEARRDGLRAKLGELLAALLAGAGFIVAPAEVAEVLAPRRPSPAAPIVNDEDVLARVVRFAPCSMRALRQRLPPAWSETDARGISPLVHALGRLEARGLVRITRQPRKSMLVEVPAPIGPASPDAATIVSPALP